jgi:ferredoxin
MLEDDPTRLARQARLELKIMATPPTRSVQNLSLRPGLVPAIPGETLLAALQRAGTSILSICGGHASCGACRVEIETDWLDRPPPPGKVERELLEFLDEPAAGHRLACQVTIEPALDGLSLTLAP